MKNIATGMLLFAMVGLSACAMTNKTSGERSAQASQKLILDDQRDIEKADAHYKDIVLKHGESSDEAVKAKTQLDNAVAIPSLPPFYEWSSRPSPVSSSSPPLISAVAPLFALFGGPPNFVALPGFP